MNIVILSLWRNDENRKIFARASHLLKKKSVGNTVYWLWAVGDSNDATEKLLRTIENPRVKTIRCDTKIEGIDLISARRRSSTTATMLFRHISPEMELVCFHESDLQSPENLLDLMIDNPWPIAGWPIINLNGKKQFYDIWAYRNLNGQNFHPDIRQPKVTGEVLSFGSVWMAPANMFRDRILDETCCVGLCKQWRDEGHKLWVDPTIEIEQPVDLWQAM